MNGNKKMTNQPIDDQRLVKLLNSCKQIAGSREIASACLFGARAGGYENEKSGIYVLLVIKNYPSRLMVYPRLIEGLNAFFLVVDCGLFETDVERGIVGEFVAEKIMLPYTPLIGTEFLWCQEVKLKKRIVWEILENLVLQYPEMSHEFLIKPEYFMYEDMTRKSRLFPLMIYSFLNMLRKDLKKPNTEQMMKAYSVAICQLSREGWITINQGCITINTALIERVNKRRIRLRALFRTAQRGLLTYVLRVFPGVVQHIFEDQELYLRTHNKTSEEELMFHFDASQKYLLIPTPNGPVPLSDTTRIEDFIYKLSPNGKINKIERLGGVLNTVYLVSYEKNGEKHRVVVKQFEDWFAFKWFPLAFWTLGTNSFAVLGQTRLEREYAINQFFNQHGFKTAKILHVSPQQRLVFKEYVEGTNMTEIIKHVIASKERATAELVFIRKVGEKIAKAHKLGVALGDCKPENIIITKDEEPIFLDLEQATRKGNKPWDIAEFLYYSGHYTSPIANPDAAELITKAFIQGYLVGEGRKETIKKAWSAQYTKVFSIFTPPQVIFAISNICRKIDKLQENEK
jgi:tRNA A-37 threonylcarbamoyl transferase component Bud32